MTSELTWARLTRGTDIRWQCDRWRAEGCSDTCAWRAGVPPPPHPAGPGWGSMPWTPSIQSQREAGLHCWDHGFSSHILTSGHIQVTSFIPLGLCSESQHVGGLDLLGRLATSNWWGQCIRRELLLRLKSHSDDWLRPHPWLCCRCKFTADTGRTHCDDTTEFLRFESKARLLCSPPPSSPCKELPLLRIQTPRELPAALLSYCSFLNQAWVELIRSTQMASLNPNQHHFHYTELNFSWTTQVNNEKKWTDMLPSHEALHWKFLLNKISSQYELILVQTS